MKISERRLKILTTGEIEELYGLPDFTPEEREKYFSLSADECSAVKALRSIASKVHFVLLLGYFKAKKVFFIFTTRDVKKDIAYVLQQYFPDQIRTQIEITKPTRLAQQNTILALLDYHACTEKVRNTLQGRAAYLMKIFPKPIYVFRELLNYTETHQIVTPAYSLLRKIIGQALVVETSRLESILSGNLSNDIAESLDKLLSADEGMYELTLLKKEPKNFSYKVIVCEIQKREAICQVYDFARKFLPTLGISNENIRYYATLAGYYNIYRLRRMKRETVSIYLICFVFHRYQKINDDLIRAFIYYVSKYINEARKAAKEQVYNYKTEANSHLKEAGKVLQLFINEDIPKDAQFSLIKSMAFEILEKDKFSIVSRYISKMKFDETEYEWKHYVHLANTFKRNLRQIFINIGFKSQAEGDCLIQSTSFLKKIFGDKKPLGHITPDSFPKEIIPEKLKGYICSPDNQINADKYEFLVYRQLRSHLQAGDVYVDESISFRSFEEEPVEPEKWKQKDELIQSLEFPYLSKSIDSILTSFEETLEQKLKIVDESIKFGFNSHIKFDKAKKTWKLPYEKPDDNTNHSFYEQLPQVSIGDVLHFANEQCQFTRAFSHVLGKDVRNYTDYNSLSASILAQGLNIGLTKMDEISDINYAELANATNNFIRLETLKKANDLVSNQIAALPIFEHYNIKNDTIHSSSDGQKFETQFHTINSRYSPKYFGLKKGISAYTLIANHVPINAKIFGANAHESHYVFDIIYNNTSDIEPDIHSTDTHGTNEINFAILHIFGYLFAPRYNNLAGRQNMIYGFNNPSFYEDYTVRPVRKIDTQLIKDEWENILRIIVSLGLKSTTQAAIIRRLSSYERVNKTKRALWEYDNIIKSMYVLDYIDSLELRQNVQKALNRGEAYHQLRRAVSYAHFGKFRVKSETEQQVWNDCSRLIANSIIFYNAYILSELLKQKKYSKNNAEADFIKKISPVAWRHINLYGHYEFHRGRSLIDIDKIICRVGDIKFSNKN
ncbi:MAG: Tn3 family transposase [Candidatus Brocadiaceae bacterium]|nr:Tn3 family transposase [Candidatus Brocadiaceae bacterium]